MSLTGLLAISPALSTRNDVVVAYRVLHSFEELPDDRAHWDKLVAELGAPIYMSFDWLRLWWQYYGAGKELRLFVFQARGVVVGMVPTYIEQLGPPFLCLRVARLIGANIPPRVFNPPVPPELARTIWGLVFDHLVEQDSCDVVSVGPVSERYAANGGLRDAATAKESSWTAEWVSKGVCTLYNLPSSFDEFMASLDGKERKTRRKKLRELEARGELRVEVIKDCSVVAAEFDRFVDLHTRQWESEGRPGHFHAWPRALEFHRSLVAAQGALGRLRFVRLLAGNTLVANQYNYAFGGTLFAELPARVFGPEWDRLSLGCSSQVKLIEAAIQEGFHTMDSGPGHYDYKVLLNGQESKIFGLCLTAARRSSHLKTQIYRGIGKLLILLIVKLWYRRISPRLPKIMRTGQPWVATKFDF